MIAMHYNACEIRVNASFFGMHHAGKIMLTYKLFFFFILPNRPKMLDYAKNFILCYFFKLREYLKNSHFMLKIMPA